MKLNWFQVSVALLEVGAAIQYLRDGNPLLAGVMLAYAVASAILATL